MGAVLAPNIFKLCGMEVIARYLTLETICLRVGALELVRDFRVLDHYAFQCVTSLTCDIRTGKCDLSKFVNIREIVFIRLKSWEEDYTLPPNLQSITFYEHVSGFSNKFLPSTVTYINLKCDDFDLTICPPKLESMKITAFSLTSSETVLFPDSLQCMTLKVLVEDFLLQKLPAGLKSLELETRCDICIYKSIVWPPKLRKLFLLCRTLELYSLPQSVETLSIDVEEWKAIDLDLTSFYNLATVTITLFNPFQGVIHFPRNINISNL